MDILQAKTALEAEIVSHGYSIVYRKSLSGCVRPTKKICEIPEAKTRASLYIVCHELSHVLGNNYGGKKPRYLVEMEAEKFAHKKMRELGVSIPRKMTKRAKRYVLRKINKALDRGLKKVATEAVQYIR